MISDLLADGYTFYRRPEPVRIDCQSMRLLEDHLWHLADVLDYLSPSDGAALAVQDEQEPQEWHRIPRWLRLAAGLRYVDVDTGYGEPDTWLCGSAMDYQAAANDTASLWATEQTRLQYVWNAAERLVKVLKLPVVKEAPGRFNAATKLLKAEWGDRPLPPHYTCVARHLRMHVETDPELRNNAALVATFDEKLWRGKSGLLIAAANQLRHPPAHGDLTVPEPVNWTAGEPEGARPFRAAFTRLGLRPAP
jgi:hypothetical protein